MNTNKIVKIAFFSLLLSLTCLYAQAKDGKEDMAFLEKSMLQQVDAYHEQALQAAAENMVYVKTLWQVSNTKTVRRRNVTVTVAWGSPWTVQTLCEGIEKDGKLYVVKSCYYPALEENQTKKKLNTELVRPNLQTVTLADHTRHTNQWIIFSVPEKEKLSWSKLSRGA